MSHNLNCKHCGKPFTAKRIDTLYCSRTCATYSSNDRVAKGKGRKGNKKSLSGLPPVQKPEEQKTVIKPETPSVLKVVKPSPPGEGEEKNAAVTFADMPPLRGYTEKVVQDWQKYPAPPEPPPEFNRQRPVEVLPEYRAVTRQTANPALEKMNKRIDEIAARYKHHKDLFDKIKLEYAEIEKETNMGKGYAVGAGAGIAAGVSFSERNNQLAGGFFGGLLGLFAAGVIDVCTQDGFNKRKKERLKAKADEAMVQVNICNQLNEEYNQLKAEAAQLPKLIGTPAKEIANQLAVDLSKAAIVDYDTKKTQADKIFARYLGEVQKYEEKYGSIEAIEAARENAPPAARVDDPAVVSSVGLDKVVGGSLLLRGAWKGFIGAPSRNFMMVLNGPSGSGKSHLAIQFGHYLAVHHGPVLYVSSEEGLSNTMDSKFERLKAKVKDFDIAAINTAADLMKKIPRNAYCFIILDSVNNMRIDAETLRQICDHYCCSAIIGVCQNTKDGKIRGSYELVHDADIRLIVEGGIATTDKNRFIEDKPELEVFKIPAVPAVREPQSKDQEKKTPPPPDNPPKKDKPNDEQNHWDWPGNGTIF